MIGLAKFIAASLIAGFLLAVCLALVGALLGLIKSRRKPLPQKKNRP
jgi:hypothetical protein